jgi:hypothetical protein
MKILVQNIHSKFYFCLLDIWTENSRAAFDFRNSEQALEFVRKRNMKDVQLVVKFEDPQWDEIVPLPLFVAMLGARAVV